MIGPKKLDTIREEIRQALAATGDDPIHWLEQQMSAESSEVLQSLRRLLEGTGPKKARKPRARTKK
jgi:DnaJ-domain-containing protein 1